MQAAKVTVLIVMGQNESDLPAVVVRNDDVEPVYTLLVRCWIKGDIVLSHWLEVPPGRHKETVVIPENVPWLGSPQKSDRQQPPSPQERAPRGAQRRDLGGRTGRPGDRAATAFEQLGEHLPAQPLAGLGDRRGGRHRPGRVPAAPPIQRAGDWTVPDLVDTRS